MAVEINLSNLSRNGAPLTVGQPDDSDELIASATAAHSSIYATEGDQVWEICPDADIYVVFSVMEDADPTVPPHRFLKANIPRTFGVMSIFERVHIIQA